MKITKQELLEINNELESTFEAWKLDPENIELRNSILDQSKAMVNRVTLPFEKSRLAISYEDLQQEAYIGIIKSLEKIAKNGYDKGFLYRKILAYIRKHILECLDRSDLIILESSLYINLYKLKTFQKNFLAENHRPATAIEVSKSAGISKSGLRTLSLYFNVETCEKLTDLIVPSFSEFGDSIAIENGVDNAESSQNEDSKLIESENGLSNILEKEKRNIIINEIKKLSDVNKKIILTKYGAYGEKETTASELSKELNIPTPKIYKIRQAIEDHLRKKVLELA